MIELRPCPACHRHVADEVACPFCGAAREPAAPHRIPAGRLSRAAVFASATLAGCWSSNAGSKQVDQHVVEQQPDPTDHHDGTPVDKGPPPVAGTGHVEGVITDSSGNPVVGIAVTLNAAGGEQTTSTDARGHYAFHNVAVGAATILVRTSNNPRHSPMMSGVTVSDGGVAVGNMVVTYPRSNPSNIPMPYGAPPARRRVV